MKISINKEILEPIIKANTSFKGILTDLGVVYANGSLKSLKSKIKEFNIDISHFYGGNKTPRGKTYSNEEIFKKESLYSSASLRKKLIKEKLIPYICSNCGQDENWMGNKMPLILDHINGINNDNRLENLRFLCSNCDSIQPTYKGKNNNKSLSRINNRKSLIKSYII